MFIFLSNFCVVRRFSGILNCEDLTEVDPVRGRFLRQIQSLIARKSRIAQDNTLSPEARAHQIQNLALVSSSGPVVRLEDLAITFTYLPSSQVFGFSAAELTPGSCDKEVNFPPPPPSSRGEKRYGWHVNRFLLFLLFQVTMENVEEYSDLTTAFCLEKGITRQLNAFHSGFNKVFPITKLKAFSPDEVRIMLCGDQNPHWTREDVLNYTEPKLGYTRDR